MNESLQGKGQGSRARRAALITAALLAVFAATACAGGDGETTTDEPAPTGGSGGAAGATGGTGGTSNGGTGGTSEGGTGGTSDGGTGGGADGGTGGGADGGTGGGADGGTGGGADGGTGGTCDQADWEPNDSETTARPLLDIGCGDSDGGSIQGTLGPGDVDWFTFTASDEISCSVNPYLNLTSPDNVTVCLFFKCDSGTTEVTCPDGSQDWSSNPLHPGCCASLTPLEPKINCGSTLDETARVWIQVSWIANTSCRSYSIDYHY